MYNQECASLILNTSDLSVGASNSVGTLDAYITNATWNNINMRTLLGNMYDKYDRFALVPVKYQTEALPIIPSHFAGVEDLSLTLNIGGLPFTNNVYNAGSKTNTSYATFNTIILNEVITYSLSGGSILTFTKNQELVNLNIFYKRVLITAGNNNIVPISVFPNFIMMFNIYGIDKHARVADLNSSRIFLNK